MELKKKKSTKYMYYFTVAINMFYGTFIMNSELVKAL